MSAAAAQADDLHQRRRDNLIAFGKSEDEAELLASHLDSVPEQRSLAAELPSVTIGGCLDLADAMPDLQPVLGSIFYQGQVITLTANPGHGKSTTMISAGFSLALQTSYGIMRPQREGLVYYCSVEDLEGTRKRIFAEAVTRRLPSGDRERLNRNLRWVQLRGVTAPSVMREHIEDDARGATINVVMIDTGPAMFAGDNENDNVQQQQFATECRVLTELPGTPCVIVFWHPVKNASIDNLTPRGGSALLGAIDGNLRLWHDADANVTTLFRDPWKWRGDHFEPLHFRFETVPLVLPSGKPASVNVAVPLDAPPPRSASKPIRRDVALDALLEMVGETGQQLPGTSAVPPGVKAVTLEQWRTRWALRTGYAESSPDSIRNNFNKDKDALLKAGKIAICSPHVWAY